MLGSLGLAVARLFRAGGERLEGTVERSPTIPSQALIDPALHDVVLTATPLDRDGRPHRPTLRWLCDDTSVLRLEVSADTLSALGISVGEGVATVTVSDGEVLSHRKLVVEKTQPARPTVIGLSFAVIGKKG